MSKIKIYDRYFGKQLPIRERFYNIIFTLGFLGGATGMIACMMLGSSSEAIITSGAMAIYMPGMMFISSIDKKHQKQLMSFAILFLNLIILPSIYLTGGEINCGIPSYFVLMLAFTLFLLPGKTGVIIAIIEALNYLFIFYLGYSHPEIAILETDKRFEYQAIASNCLMVACLMGLAVKSVFNMYVKENMLVKKTIDKLDEMATIDPLTTTYNRRYMYEYLTKHTKEFEDKNIPLSVVMFDIDHFKNLNDDFGHLTGDSVLISVSAIIKSHCQNKDIVARYGGEEFLLIMPDTRLEDAEKRANNIRESISEKKFDAQITRPVTISGGVAEFHTGMNSEELIDEADKALYTAKDTGRNKICISSALKGGASY